jgi:hypothetical protein
MIAELSVMRGGLRSGRAEAQCEIAGGAKFNRGMRVLMIPSIGPVIGPKPCAKVTRRLIRLCFFPSRDRFHHTNSRIALNTAMWLTIWFSKHLGIQAYARCAHVDRVGCCLGPSVGPTDLSVAGRVAATGLDMRSRRESSRRTPWSRNP